MHTQLLERVNFCCFVAPPCDDYSAKLFDGCNFFTVRRYRPFSPARSNGITSTTYGFTMIEVLVVVAVVSILALTAIGQFSSFKRRSYDAQAEAEMRNGMTAQEVYYVDNQLYVDCSDNSCENLLPGFFRDQRTHLEYSAQAADQEFSTAACHDGGTKEFQWKSSGTSAGAITFSDFGATCAPSAPVL